MAKNVIAEYSEQHIKEYLTDYVQQITEPTAAAGTNKYICPFCKSGTGEHQTGAFSIAPSGTAWHCFACGRGGDLLDLIKELENLTTYQAAARALELYEGKATPKKYINGVRSKPTRQDKGGNYTRQQLAQFARNIQEPGNKAQKYLKMRGFTADTILKNGLGYDGKNLIVPYLDKSGFYFMRGIGTNYKGKPRGFKDRIYKAAELEQKQPCFVVEGQLDALAVIQCGGHALALGSTNNTRLLLEHIDQAPPKCTLILSLDNDSSGQQASQELAEELQARGVDYIIKNISGQYKDAAERLAVDVKGLEKEINKIYLSFESEL